MKFTKILGVVAVAALALMAFASTASATRLEVNGVAKTTEDVTLEATLKSGTSALLTDTFNAFANTCTVSTVKGTDSTSTGGTGVAVSGPVSELSWSSCTEGNPTVDAKGSLTVENVAGTTNGTVKSLNAKVTVPSALGPLTCTTPATGGTDLGTLKGVASGNASLKVEAVLSCGITAKWTGEYVVTSPTGLGVTA